MNDDFSNVEDTWENVSVAFRARIVDEGNVERVRWYGGCRKIEARGQVKGHLRDFGGGEVHSLLWLKVEAGVSLLDHADEIACVDIALLKLSDEVLVEIFQ